MYIIAITAGGGIFRSCALLNSDGGAIISLTNDMRPAFRVFDITDDGFSIEKGLYAAYYGGGGVEDNKLIVPYRIYGVK